MTPSMVMPLVLLASSPVTQCPPVCPPFSLLEGEACGEEINKGCDAPGPKGSDCCVSHNGNGCDDPDCTNAVCGADPFCCSVAWDQICADLAIELCVELCSGRIQQKWTPLPLDRTICGQTWAEGFSRDVDWYAVTLDATTEVNVTLTSGVAMELGIADIDGQPECLPGVELEPAIVVPGCSTGSFTACLEAGTHYLRVRPTATGGVRCGGFEARYVLSLDAIGTGCVLPDPIHDVCATAVEIFEGSTPVDTHDAATDGEGIPAECGIDPDFLRDVWYRHVATRDGTLRISTCGTANFLARLAAYSGDCDSLRFLGCDDDGLGCIFGDPQLDIEVEAGRTYYLRIGSRVEADGQLVATLSYVHCEAPYAIQVISDDPSEEFEASGVSEGGEVVGQRKNGHGYGFPFRWTEETGLVDVTVSPQAPARFFAVNSAGLAVGWSEPGPQVAPAAAAATTMTLLPTLPVCSMGIAYDVNEAGHIVGGLFAVKACGSPTPVEWVDGVIAALPVPAWTKVAKGVNDRGDICGDSDTLGWTLVDGVFTEIASPLPGMRVRPSRINNAGLVVGTLDVSGLTPPERAFVWDGSAVELIPLPNGYERARGIDINDSGLILGELPAGSGEEANSAPFISRGSALRLLNMLTGPDADLPVRDVRDVNNAGVIAGASNSKAVRLVPRTPTGDLNCDGDVDATDLAGVLGAWGPCELNNTCLADLDLDGVVGAADLAIVLGAWGRVR